MFNLPIVDPLMCLDDFDRLLNITFCYGLSPVLAPWVSARGVHYTKHVRIYVSAQKGY